MAEKEMKNYFQTRILLINSCRTISCLRSSILGQVDIFWNGRVSQMKMRWLVMIMICVAPTGRTLERKISSSDMKEGLTTQETGLKRKDLLVLTQHIQLQPMDLTSQI